MNSSFLFYLFIEIIAVSFLCLGTMENSGKIKQSEKNKNSIFIFLSFLTLFLVVILRDISVGTDYINYKNYYLRINAGTITLNEIKDFGYLFYAFAWMFTKMFAGNYLIFYGAVAFITLLFLYKVILKYSKIPWLSLFIFFSFCQYYQMFNQLRQLLTMLISLYSLKYVFNKSFFKYSLAIIIASLIHTSALIMLPCYFIFSKFNNKKILLYTALGIIAFGFSDVFREIIVHTKYGVYLGTTFDQTFSINTILNLGVRVVMLIVALYFRKEAIEKDSKNAILYNGIFICTVLQFLTVKISLFGRLTTYFYMFYILLIPEILFHCIKNKKNKALLTILLVIGLTIYHYIYFSSQFGAIASGYANYKTFL